MQTSQHRSRIGAERRHKTRLRLIESALEVFAAKGVDATVIEDVIASAGVSRGTFYNYFRTDAELLAAVGEAVSNETVRRIESVVGGLPDPAERLAQGLRLCLHLALAYPLFARFFSRSGFNAIGPGHLMFEYVPRHIQEAVAAKRMDVPEVALAVDLLGGAVLSAVHAIATRPVAKSYPEKMVLQLLLGLGMTRAAAQKLVAVPLLPIHLSPNSLLVRTRPAVAQPRRSDVSVRRAR
jgi:AcrR family transcriptional regulator